MSENEARTPKDRLPVKGAMDSTGKSLSDGKSYKGIPFYIGDLQKEADLIRGNCIAVLRDTSFTVEIKDLPTSMVHLNRKRIYISDRAIPTNLRIYEPIVRRMRDGIAVHEAGHIMLGYPLIPLTRAYLEKHRGSALARVCHNIIEDRRINYRLAARYRWDFGKRLQEVSDVTAKSWLHTLQLEVDAVNAGKKTAHTLGEVFHQWVCIEGLYDLDCKDLRDKFYRMWGGGVNKDQVEKDFLKVCELIRESEYVAQGRKIFDMVEQVHTIFSKYVPEDVAADTLAGFMGGVKQLWAPGDMESDFDHEQNELNEAREKGLDEPGEDSLGGYGAATGSGLEIPCPEPDIGEYQSLVMKNASYIDALLRKLKKLIQPYTVTTKWRRAGRFMSEVLAHAYAQSMSVPVDSVYQRREVRVEPLRSAVALLVDVSASVSTEEARDLLTIISEVCGRWLRDDDIAIGVFGGIFQRIKAFVEPYHTTKTRIGSVKCLSGTVAGPPAAAFGAMLRSIGKRRRVFVFVSDYDLSDQTEFQKEVEAMRKDGVLIAGIAFGHTSKRKAENVLGGGSNIRVISGPQALPDAFFDVYRDAVSGKYKPVKEMVLQ